MKTLLLNLWAWVVMHPVEVTGAAVSALVAIATVINARSKGPAATWLARFVDLLAARTREGAKNAGWSLPLFGRSIFEAAIEASMPAPIEPARETIAPEPAAPDVSGPRSSEPGFAERGVLKVIAGVAMLALGMALLTGCRMPAPDGCSPGARRCFEDTPQVCSPGQRWTPADVTCSTVSASCVVRDGVPACLRGDQ